MTYSNEQNQADTSSHLLYIGQRTSSTGQVTLLTDDADRQLSCPCQTFFAPLISAADGQSGITSAKDDTNVDVLCAYQYSSDLDVGLTLKVDMKVVQQPLMTAIGILLGTALGMTILGVFLIGFFSQRMLRNIEETWEQGKRAVEEESARFQSLISAMYPKFVTEQLMSGTTRIVLELPKVMLTVDWFCP